MLARMLYVYTLSPLHCGTGQAVAVIDLPIARERATGWPLIPGSSLKGPLKLALRPENDPTASARWRAAFGPDLGDDLSGGALAFGDLRALCFPVRSYAGTFAWATCPLALRRWIRDYEHGGLACDATAPDLTDKGQALVPPGSALVDDGRIYLEDLDLIATEDAGLGRLAERLAATLFDDADWRAAFTARVAVLSDEVFTFLAETATEVSARVRLDESKKTTAPHALWYEEAVPAEAVFAGPVLAVDRDSHAATTLLEVLPERSTLQIGGHTSVGRGLVELRVRGDLA